MSIFRSTDDTSSNVALLEFDDHDAETPEVPAEFVLPENLAEISDETLGDLEAQAIAAFDAIRAGSLDTDALQSLSDLTEAINALRAEAAVRMAAAEEAMAAAEALAAQVHGAADETDDADLEVTDPVTPEGDDHVEAADDAEQAPEVTPEPVAEVVVAAAQPAPRRRISVPLGRISAAAPDPEVGANDMPLAIVAAADLPGVTSGSRFPSIRSVATAMHGRARTLGNGNRAPIAQIERPATHTIPVNASFEEQDAIIAAAADPAVLTASGGWCAPSQFFYDLFSIEAVDGLLDLPSVNIERGGLQFVVNGGPSIADVLSTTATVPWLWTEQNDEDAADNPHVDPDDDVTKPCIVIPCVTFDEERLDAHGVCISHGNLADRAYPELTARYVSLVMAAHEHMMNYRKVTAVEADSHAVTMGASVMGTTANILGATELQVLDYRDKFRMSQNALLEAVYPMWLKGNIRSDLAKRLGVELLSVTDAMIDQWLAMRGVRAQFIYDWQSLQTGGTGMLANAADGYREAYPTSVKFLLYAAGTHVWGSGGVIDLGVVRDSTLNATNDFTAAWTEEFHLHAKRGHESRVVTVPIEPTGATHGGVTDTESATQTY